MICLLHAYATPYHDKYQPREMRVERGIIFLGNATIYNLRYDSSALRSKRQSGGLFLLADQKSQIMGCNFPVSLRSSFKNLKRRGNKNNIQRLFPFLIPLK